MEYKYFAFISYNSKDTEWGKRLQRKLEHYKMPATLCSEHGWKRKIGDGSGDPNRAKRQRKACFSLCFRDAAYFRDLSQS